MPDVTLTVSGSMLWLSLHQHIAYGILFLGAYFETLVGPGFFIPGELFLIPGAILGGAHVLNIFTVAASLYSGAILGDTSSYFIGRKIGASVFKEGGFVFSMEHYRKGESFFKRFGHKAIFFARILGPLSWITPFLAGVYGISYSVFLAYNIPGILVGVGIFLVVGYFFGNQYELVFNYISYFIVFITLTIILYVIWKQYRLKKQSEENSIP